MNIIDLRKKKSISFIYIIILFDSISKNLFYVKITRHMFNSIYFFKCKHYVLPHQASFNVLKHHTFA